MSAPTMLKQPSWFVIQSKPKQEFRALEHLQNQGYTCFLPTLHTEKVRRGKVETCIEPLFSRYLFIQMNTVDSNWFPIRSTRGVSNVVTIGGRFASVPDAIVEALQDSSRFIRQPLFKHGERVTIASGPFAGVEGIYQMSDGDARAMVLIELMSQPQKLMFAVDMLRKAA